MAIKHSVRNLDSDKLARDLWRKELICLEKLKGKQYILQIYDHFEKDSKQFVVT